MMIAMLITTIMIMMRIIKLGNYSDHENINNIDKKDIDNNDSNKIIR